MRITQSYTILHPFPSAWRPRPGLQVTVMGSHKPRTYQKYPHAVKYDQTTLGLVDWLQIHHTLNGP
jgi:hypothetical protein